MIGRKVIPDTHTFAPLGNYYGGVSVFTFEDKRFLALGDVASGGCIEVSEAFYQAFLTEFAALGIGFLDQDVEYTICERTGEAVADDKWTFENEVDDIVHRWVGDCGHTYWNTEEDYYVDLPQGNVRADRVVKARAEVNERFKGSRYRAHISCGGGNQ